MIEHTLSRLESLVMWSQCAHDGRDACYVRATWALCTRDARYAHTRCVGYVGAAYIVGGTWAMCRSAL
jgi:hypothetical protein